MNAKLATVAAGAMLALQGATFNYVLSIEHRLTALETRAALQDSSREIARAKRGSSFVVSPAAIAGDGLTVQP